MKHKILTIAEEEGAHRASYALKLLQSEGELTIASTSKDPRHRPGPEQWLLIAWLADDAEPLKYYLSTLPAEAPPNDLVALAQRRWRVFHHHAALTIAAHGLLVSKHLNVSGTSKNFHFRPIPAVPARQSGGSSVTSPTHWPRCAMNSAHDCSGG